MLCCLFVEVIELCREAGMVKVGRLAIDGAQVQPNASKLKGMSCSHSSEFCIAAMNTRTTSRAPATVDSH